MVDNSIKLLAFDTFGTVFNMKDVDVEEISKYVDYVKNSGPRYIPLKVPPSWSQLEVHPDIVEGLNKLKALCRVVTLSNCPTELLIHLNRVNNLQWDTIIPLELAQVFKPHIRSYLCVERLFGCKSHQIGMVTANPGFGDLKAADELGWRKFPIRCDEGYKDLDEVYQKVLQLNTIE